MIYNKGELVLVKGLEESFVVKDQIDGLIVLRLEGFEELGMNFDTRSVNAK